MKQQLKETSISKDSLEREEKWEWKQSRGNNYYEYDIIVSGNKLIHYEGETPEDGQAIVKLICESVNNYNALKSVNKELIEALEGFIYSVEHEGEIHGRIFGAIENANNALKKAKQL